MVEEEVLVDGEIVMCYVGIKIDGDGVLIIEEYDQVILDLVNYLEYIGELFCLELEFIGKWVFIFILVLFVFVFMFKKEFW